MKHHNQQKLTVFTNFPNRTFLIDHGNMKINKFGKKTQENQKRYDTDHAKQLVKNNNQLKKKGQNFKNYPARK